MERKVALAAVPPAAVPLSVSVEDAKEKKPPVSDGVVDTVLPPIVRSELGVEVPIPKKPLFRIVAAVVLPVSPTRKIILDVAAVFPLALVPMNVSLLFAAVPPIIVCPPDTPVNTPNEDESSPSRKSAL